MPRVQQALERFRQICRPDNVVWCDGSDDEADRLTKLMVDDGILIELAWPGCHLHRSHPGDVARVEGKTFICSHHADDAGPTNRWWDPREARETLEDAFAGSMVGRTLYVVPYGMGPEGSRFARPGIQFTDSPYVVLSMRAMTRMGTVAWEAVSAADDIVFGYHGTGDLDPERRWICHFPEDREIWSFGSNYGGNALLGKKCFALRIASAMGRDEGWMAEHMLLVEVVDPEGQPHYVAAAFPSACGKTNLAMLQSTLPGWQVRMIGDDIAWLRVGEDGRLWAVNPENGLFGVVPGTSPATNPIADAMIRRDTVFTNVALTDDGQPWWEGCGREPGEYLTDWRGIRRPVQGSTEPFAHPNSRFTVSLDRCPNLSGKAKSASGVPISAILFGGRRDDTMPLVLESLQWRHGVYLGASMASQATAAAEGTVGTVRRDPMAMLPFCGYHIGDYLGHWVRIGERLSDPPLVFHVNWFRKDDEGRFLWPGFQHNVHVLRWVVDRTRGRASALRTPAGMVPEARELAASGVDESSVQRLLAVEPDQMAREWDAVGAVLREWGERVPAEIQDEWNALGNRLRPASARVA